MSTKLSISVEAVTIMDGFPDDLSRQVVQQLEHVRDLAVHGIAIDQLNARDQREWFRGLLRVAADMRDASRQMERILSDHADATKILSPAEISEAAKISRAAVHKRREATGA